MAVNGISVRLECESQSIEPVDRLQMMLDDQGYSPSYNAVIAMADQIGADTRRRVLPQAAKPISNSTWEEDKAASVLREIVNGTIDPEYTDSIAQFSCDKAKTLSACSQAEELFVGTFAKLSGNFGKDKPIQIGCDIFTHEGRPLFIRKSYNEPSALALGRFAVNGVPFPPGSIVRIDTVREIEEAKRSGPTPGVTREINTAEIAKIAFIRMSLWTFAPNERTPGVIRRYAHEEDYSLDGWKALTTFAISDIARIADNAIGNH